jgi:hypothetical protein
MNERPTKKHRVLRAVILVCVVVYCFILASIGLFTLLCAFLALVVALLIWTELIGSETESRKARILAVITGALLVGAIVLWYYTLYDGHTYNIYPPHGYSYGRKLDSARNIFFIPVMTAFVLYLMYTRTEVTRTRKLYKYLGLGAALIGVVFAILLATHNLT